MYYCIQKNLFYSNILWRIVYYVTSRKHTFFTLSTEGCSWGHSQWNQPETIWTKHKNFNNKFMYKKKELEESVFKICLILWIWKKSANFLPFLTLLYFVNHRNCWHLVRRSFDKKLLTETIRIKETLVWAMNTCS